MKRSAGLKRTAFARIERKEADAVAKLTPKKRVRKCTICREQFEPRSMTHKACKPECAEEVAKRSAAKQMARAQRQERVKDRAALEAMKSYSDLIKEAQKEVNEWIRWRDREQFCIDCGKPFQPQKPGGSVDAGHYLSRSLAPHLRFNEDNIHAQRKNCNKPGGTTRQAYRDGLIARIGLARVEALESNNTPAHWSHDDLRTIRDTYRARLREAKKEK